MEEKKMITYMRKKQRFKKPVFKKIKSLESKTDGAASERSKNLLEQLTNSKLAFKPLRVVREIKSSESKTDGAASELSKNLQEQLTNSKLAFKPMRVVKYLESNTVGVHVFSTNEVAFHHPACLPDSEDFRLSAWLASEISKNLQEQAEQPANNKMTITSRFTHNGVLEKVVINEVAVENLAYLRARKDAQLALNRWFSKGLEEQLSNHQVAIENLAYPRFNNVKHSQSLVASAKEVLHILEHYRSNINYPAYDWTLMKFLPPFRSTQTCSLPVYPHQYEKDNICSLDKNGRASVFGTAEAHHVSSARELLEHAQLWMNSKSEIHISYLLPLKEEERKIWLDFKELDKGTPVCLSINSMFTEDVKRSIDLDYPIVDVIGGFAVAAFNTACVMFFKNGEHNNLHDFEIMECKYVKSTKNYYFYMTVEAVEEGNLGVYETVVVCSRDEGSRTLLKLVLTDRAPVGTKAMAVSLISCLSSLCKTLEDVGKEKRRKLSVIQMAARGQLEREAFGELSFLDHLHEETMKGLQRVLSFNLQFFQPDYNRTTNPDDWSLPCCCCNSGLVPRTDGTSCRGYDYDHYNQFSFSHGQFFSWAVDDGDSVGDTVDDCDW